MAKELPFFKFNTTEWITGNISYESFEIQGYFIRLCAEYWNRNNELTYEDVIKRLRNQEILDELIEKKYIKRKRNSIFINFLDEERYEISKKRQVLRDAGRKGGLSSAKGRLKHKDIDIDKEIDKDTYKPNTDIWGNEIDEQGRPIINNKK